MDDSLVEITDRDKLIDICNSGKYEPAKIDTTHEFVDGMYFRTMSVPIGSLLIGATHKKDSYEILLQGRMLVGLGEDKMEVVAPYTIKTKAGSAKVGYVLEDSVYMSVFRTDSESIEDIEEELFVEKIYKVKELGCQDCIWQLQQEQGHY